MSYKKMLVDGETYHLPNAKGQPYCGATRFTITYLSTRQAENIRHVGLVCVECLDFDMLAGMRDSGQPELF